MGWLIALAVVTALAVLPLGVSASYGSYGALVYLTVGPVRVKLYPGKKKARRQKPLKEQIGDASRSSADSRKGCG